MGLLAAVNAPVSEARLTELVDDVAAHAPARVVDHGCGRGELLTRVLEACPGATGLGIDVLADDWETTRRTAAARGVADRVRLVEGPSLEHREPANLLLCVGAWHALGGSIADAVAVLREDVSDGGRLVLGVEFWQRPPTEAQLAAMWEGTTVDTFGPLPAVVRQVADAGWRVLDLRTAGDQEWEAFESAHVRRREEWLVTHPDHPDADAERRALDAQRDAWLRGHHRVLGFATLVLAPLAQVP